MPLKTVVGQSLAYIAAFMLAVFWVARSSPRSWGVALPDDLHTYGIRYRSGADLFFRPAVGWFLEHGWMACIGLLVVALAADLLVRGATGARREDR